MMMDKANRACAMMASAALMTASPALAQWGGAGGPDRNGGSGVNTRSAVDAAILSDVSSDRQAERDAKRQPYASPGYGPIANAKQAADACAASALEEAEPGARIAGKPIARTMSTGWEVEGAVALKGSGTRSFICSVRNGSVSGIKLGE
jgi:hypothetical protein